MTSDANRTAGPGGPIRAPQNFMGGLLLLALAALALWLTRDLDQGTLRSMGPAMLPRWLAIGVGLCGLALVVSGFLTAGAPLDPWSLRGPLMVIVAVVAFAVTIRPFSFGSFQTPGLGMIVAGPLAIVIGGYASNEARVRDLAILALTLTPFCMLLFGDMLNLPIPIFPQTLADLLFAGWSQKAILRLAAAVMIAAAAAVFFLTRGRRGPVDVADHSGRI